MQAVVAGDSLITAALAGVPSVSNSAAASRIGMGASPFTRCSGMTRLRRHIFQLNWDTERAGSGPFGSCRSACVRGGSAAYLSSTAARHDRQILSSMQRSPSAPIGSNGLAWAEAVAAVHHAVEGMDGAIWTDVMATAISLLRWCPMSVIYPRGRCLTPDTAEWCDLLQRGRRGGGKDRARDRWRSSIARAAAG